ncbi:uncharacterized protein LOC134831936 [Culicoides brevitarsis]|uniref:uncharacterized protein LOC134831936 n=1 Tax=Culicoides brevitarsis TaxID=469753 RepID=UPI00307CAAD8
MTSKCCFFVPIRTAALLFGVFSLLVRLQLTYFWLRFFLTDDYKNNEYNLVGTVIEILVLGIVANLADIFLIYGIIKKLQNWVKFYQYAIIFVYLYEIFLFFVLFVLGFHWLDILEYLLLGIFHLWAWFVIRKLNSNWDEEMKGTQNQGELNSLPPNPV